MGNTDSVPVVSQMKSLTQFAFGNATAARETQNNFLYHNTFPVTSQITSLGYAIAGEPDKALDLQKKFADDMQRIVDSIPVAGHIKGGVHYALGENEEGDEAMKAASRSTGVVIGGVGGFVAGGPVGAVAGGIAGGAAVDGIITGSEYLINKEHKPYGYVAAGEHIANAIEKKRNLTVEQGFDMAMMPVGDGIAGYTAGRGIGKPLGLGVGKGKTVPIGRAPAYKPLITGTAGVLDDGLNGKVVPAAGIRVNGNGYKPLIEVADVDIPNPSITKTGAGGGAAATAGESVANKLKPVAGAVDDIAGNEAGAVNGGAHNGNYLGLDKAGLDNRANQLNPNHVNSGPGRPAGYKGLGTKPDLDNHANQMNPNNPLHRMG